ncbi:hypothetical protein CBR_g53 [Chara braunii]|uniref:mannan endo-1,4-beta-mannosidase n=1 Tax=Chara braunii TaxID=69332 RepID=A0A388JLR1_CHABU|nr:hypothetical protein CBR_g53 [Chara braunii]|eukprot:GBG58652.1 hypothetical protein CBR_g53 [Chara braunii]
MAAIAPRVGRTILVLLVGFLFVGMAASMQREQDPYDDGRIIRRVSKAQRRPYNPRKHWGIVKRNGLIFQTPDGKDFLVSGWNTRDLMYNCLTPAGRARAVNILKQARSMGLTVVRMMTCNDGSRFPYVQPSGTTFNETILVALDYLVDQASKLGVRILAVFGNNWESKAQYGDWLKQATQKSSIIPDDMFREPLAKQWFKLMAEKVVMRRNTVNRRLYREDPTIFAWEVFNEPRCVSDTSGNTLVNWLAEMGEYIKSLDKQHMLTSGVEGFYGQSDRTRWVFNPAVDWPANQGNDFLRETAISHFDFTTVHIYPQLWNFTTFDNQMIFTASWIKAHVDDCVRLNKPMLLEEFGWGKYEREQRDRFFTVAFRESLAAMKQKRLGGTMFWALEDSEGFFSGWGVYYSRDINTTVKIISDYSNEVNKLMPAP